jgi:hypothetical protein
MHLRQRVALNATWKEKPTCRQLHQRMTHFFFPSSGVDVAEQAMAIHRSDIGLLAAAAENVSRVTEAILQNTLTEFHLP